MLWQGRSRKPLSRDPATGERLNRARASDAPRAVSASGPQQSPSIWLESFGEFLREKSIIPKNFIPKNFPTATTEDLCKLRGAAQPIDGGKAREVVKETQRILKDLAANPKTTRAELDEAIKIFAEALTHLSLGSHDFVQKYGAWDKNRNENQARKCFKAEKTLEQAALILKLNGNHGKALHIDVLRGHIDGLDAKPKIDMKYFEDWVGKAPPLDPR
jgi:hypothetical protein